MSCWEDFKPVEERRILIVKNGFRYIVSLENDKLPIQSEKPYRFVDEDGILKEKMNTVYPLRLFLHNVIETDKDLVELLRTKNKARYDDVKNLPMDGKTVVAFEDMKVRCYNKLGDFIKVNNIKIGDKFSLERIGSDFNTDYIFKKL